MSAEHPQKAEHLQDAEPFEGEHFTSEHSQSDHLQSEKSQKASRHSSSASTASASGDHAKYQDQKSLPEYEPVRVTNVSSFFKYMMTPQVDNSPMTSTAKSHGVQMTELMTASYNRPILKLSYYLAAFVCSYVYALDGTLRSQFQVYATASYAQHSLFTTVTVLRSVIAAAAQPTYARLSDYFGRLELFLVAIVFYFVGTVVESQAYDIQYFAAGAVLYQIGYSGVQLILEVTLADMSNLNWRLFASFIPALPFIINTWVSGDIFTAMYPAHSWSWGIWIWAGIFPAACVPLLLCLVDQRRKACKTEEWQRIKAERKQERRERNIFLDMFWKIDVVGILLIICVFGFILVPFTLAGNKTATYVSSSTAWKQAYIIAPLVVGVCLVPVLILWEWKVAKFPIIPFTLLKDRGVWAALVIACLINFIWYMPNDFMYTVLVVGMNTSIKAATRITSLYSFVSVIVGPLLGFVIVMVKRTKAFIIFGCATWFVSMGILYHYRGSNTGLEHQNIKDGVIGGLCVLGFGAGFFTYTTQLSIQTCTNHEYMAVVLSLYLASYSIGSALGTAVSGAVWTQLMPSTIFRKMASLGVDTTLATTAYGDPFTFAATYVWGSPERRSVAMAYADIQKKMCIVGLCLCVILIVMALFLRDHRLASVQSLDEVVDHELGVHAEKPALGDTVVVNDYDKDPIAMFFKNLFHGGKR